MLKKSDLAKQFELVVKQEIKNYQDSLNFVLQSINELKDSIRVAQNESLENYGVLHSLNNDLAIQLQKIEKDVDSLTRNHERALSDQRLINERNALVMRDISSAVYSKISNENNFQNKLDDLQKELFKLKSDSETNYKVLNDNLDDLLRRFRQEILKAKKEILDAPTEASIVKNQLEEQISAHSVDVEGIMKELKIYKNDNIVTQKKIENIYTLIERLKKAEVKP